ncbi:MAG: UbiA family prenyltransferase [Kiritimatiellia bacterium]
MPSSSFSLPPLLKLMRPHQWTKNALLFFPLILAHRLFEPALLGITVLAVFCFSIMASAVYILNDYMDVEADRSHPEKKHRPLAAGTVPLRAAPWLSSGFALLALGLSIAFIGPKFSFLLAAYLTANFFYSSLLKHIPMLDAVSLTLMFVLRIYAGGVAGRIPVSFWLLTFSLFFFLSVAFAKRAQELQLRLRENGGAPQKVRGYQTSDLPFVSQLGISSGLVSVMVLALYMNSGEIAAQYQSPYWLWLLCPLMLFWIGRLWLLTHRGQMSHDPILFALRDRTSHLVLLILIALIQFAYRL